MVEFLTLGRRFTAQDFVKHHTRTMDVGTMIDCGILIDLFRRHIVWRALHAAVSLIDNSNMNQISLELLKCVIEQLSTNGLCHTID